MLESRKYLKVAPIWQYIVFAYNENNIEEAKKIATSHGIKFMIVTSSRWKKDTFDPLMPTNPKYRLPPK
jgi:hypothetical protein